MGHYAGTFPCKATVANRGLSLFLHLLLIKQPADSHPILQELDRYVKLSALLPNKSGLRLRYSAFSIGLLVVL